VLDPSPAVRRGSSGTVLVTWPDYDMHGAAQGAALARAGLSVRAEPKLGERSTAQVERLASGAVGAIVSTDPFDARVLAASPDLRVIARVGVGLDSIDVDAATAHGVAVTVTPGANEATVADHAVALMLCLIRRVVEHDAGVRRGEWNRTGRHTPGTLSGMTVGLVGYGHVGRRVAERLIGFGVRILVTDPLPARDARVLAVEFDRLLADSDVVSLHAPLTPETRGLIARRELAAMRSGAVIVNTSRGGMIDEDSLADALLSGHIAGAGLDVFACEPPGSSRLLELPNVVLSPHVAGLSGPSVAEMTRRATTSVIQVLEGRVPTDLANPEVLDRLPAPGGAS
jgi:phosphoglycerate dehydrogenase-like enzyme